MTKKRQEEDPGPASYVRPEATRVQSLSVAAQCDTGSGDDTCQSGNAAGSGCTSTGVDAGATCFNNGQSAVADCVGTGNAN
jgi:hypothetical protein